jgi:hypothetical protein
MTADWKEHHANEAEKALDQDLVQRVLTEFAGNMGFERDGLPEYGLVKIVLTVAQVARAEALGFDPQAWQDTVRKAVEAEREKWKAIVFKKINEQRAAIRRETIQLERERLREYLHAEFAQLVEPWTPRDIRMLDEVLDKALGALDAVEREAVPR